MHDEARLDDEEDCQNACELCNRGERERPFGIGALQFTLVHAPFAGEIIAHSCVDFG